MKIRHLNAVRRSNVIHRVNVAGVSPLASTGRVGTPVHTGKPANIIGARLIPLNTSQVKRVQMVVVEEETEAPPGQKAKKLMKS